MFILNLSSSTWSRHLFNINLLQLVNFSLVPNPENPAEIFLLGGIFVKKKKNNRSIYSILVNSKNIKKIEDTKKEIDQEIINNCF